MAISHLQNDDDVSDDEIVGSKKSIQPVDAISLAKAYVTAGIAQSIQVRMPLLCLFTYRINVISYYCSYIHLFIYNVILSL